MTAQIVDLTRELVSIPSHEDERAAGEFIAEWLRRETDADVEHTDAGVIAHRDGGGIALVGHHDVVPPADTQLDDDGEGYTIEERDGRLYGRGSADMKGALAAAMYAFRDADAPCTFASFRGEEKGGLGAQQAIDGGVSPEYAIVVEGSTGYSAENVIDVGVAHKGRRASTLHASGTAAHASEPEAGENAIYRATDAVAALRDLTPPETSVLGHSMSGTCEVTEIEGGTAWNVIPESCSITIDERTVPGERCDIESVTTPGVEWIVDQDIPPMSCDEPAFAQLVLDAASTAQPDREPELVTKPHVTDAGWLADAGTTCVICGAAELGEAHTDTESVSISVLERCYAIYSDAIERMTSA